jgi:hypothetical protein
MSFLLKGDKLVVEGGKLVTTDDPSNCKCCDTPPCSGSCDDSNPCPPGCYCCNGKCQGKPCCETESGSFTRSYGGCESVSDIETVTNNFGKVAYLKASGNVDDDVLIDGTVYQEGQFAFPWEYYGAPCGSTNSSNGYHAWSFEKELQPGESVKFGGKDNGYGGGIEGTWTLSTCKDPPPPPPPPCEGGFCDWYGSCPSGCVCCNGKCVSADSASFFCRQLYGNPCETVLPVGASYWGEPGDFECPDGAYKNTVADWWGQVYTQCTKCLPCPDGYTRGGPQPDPQGGPCDCGGDCYKDTPAPNGCSDCEAISATSFSAACLCNGATQRDEINPLP